MGTSASEWMGRICELPQPSMSPKPWPSLAAGKQTLFHGDTPFHISDEGFRKEATRRRVEQLQHVCRDESGVPLSGTNSPQTQLWLGHTHTLYIRTHCLDAYLRFILSQGTYMPGCNLTNLPAWVRLHATSPAYGHLRCE